MVHGNSESKASSPGASTTSSSSVGSRSALAYHNTPCFNCGRYGAIAGRMLRGSDDSTYCSADCGWSCLIRSADHQNAVASKTTSMIRIDNGNHHGNRVSRSGNHHHNHQGNHHNNNNHQHHHGRRNCTSTRNSSAQNRSKRNHSQGTNSASKTSARPPRSPATPASKNSSGSNSFDGHAMYDFSLKFNN